MVAIGHESARVGTADSVGAGLSYSSKHFLRPPRQSSLQGSTALYELQTKTYHSEALDRNKAQLPTNDSYDFAAQQLRRLRHEPHDIQPYKNTPHPRAPKKTKKRPRTSFVTGVKSVSMAAVSRKPKCAYAQYPHSTHKNASNDS